MRTLAAVFAGLVGALIACNGAATDSSSSSADIVAKKDAGHHDIDDAGQGDASDAAPTSELRIIVEPSDHGAALVAAISAATTSVHMTMYELSASDVLDALVARHQAGVEVKVVLNAHFPDPSEDPNTDGFNQLQAAGVPVVWSSDDFSYTHEKCVVLDGTTAWIMTMNAAEASQVENREYLAVDSDAASVAEAEAQFAADFAGTAYTPSGPLLMSPVTMRPGIVALVESATTTLDFEVEEMDDPDFVDDLCAAATRHVTVRGLLSNGKPSNLGQDALTKLKACGVTMGTLATPYIHAKAIVVDGARAYVGSANFSTTSLDKNRELGLVTSEAGAVATINTTLTGDIANGQAL